MHNENQLQKDVNELLTILLQSNDPNKTASIAAEIIFNEKAKGGNN